MEEWKRVVGEGWRARVAGAALAVGVLLFVVFQRGLSGETLVVCTLFLTLVALTVTDLQTMLMPNRIVYPALIVMFLLRLFIHPQPWTDYLLGFIIGGGILTLLGLVSNGMGGGDVKVFALIGLGLGVEIVLYALFASCLWGTLIGLPLRWSGRIQPRQPIPFGPFILLGTLTAWTYNGVICPYFCWFL